MKFFSRFIFPMLLLGALACSEQSSSTMHIPARWIFNVSNLALYDNAWTGEGHYIGAMNGTDAKIEVVRSTEIADRPLEYRIANNIRPQVNGMGKDDYILFTYPVKKVEAGSHIEIDAVLTSSPDSPRYFIAEIFDGKEWRHSERDLRNTENGTRYTFECHGKGQCNSIYQTFRLEKPIKNGEIRIRFRVADEKRCSEGSETGNDGWIGFEDHGYIAAHIQNLGTRIPQDTISVLCLGNSFTYYNNTLSMLKEIGWSQGHYIDVCAHLKGGQSFGQHTTLSLSQDACKAHKYDYALLQNHSTAAAQYIKDTLSHSHIPQDYLQLCGMVLENSPECRIILEHTWPYKAYNCRGFDSLESFNAHLKAGCIKMAGLNGAGISHIGDAFMQIIEGDTDINLYHSDRYHQSHYGSYLKACVNHLMITGERFKGEVADCGIDPKKAVIIRNAAEKTVFGE